MKNQIRHLQVIGDDMTQFVVDFFQQTNKKFDIYNAMESISSVKSIVSWRIIDDSRNQDKDY